jgi:alpha-tubulin suppressor-like RCC1 family protein
VYTSCARTTTAPPDGGTGTSVYCWGKGGELGDGTVTESLTPRRVPNLDNVTQLSLSSNSGTTTTFHACGVRSTGAAFCWGSNSYGELGDNSQNISRVPVVVTGITDALELTAGGNHACARRTSGLSCWGFGQSIGDGTNVGKLVPTAVSTSTATSAITAGSDHTIARTSTNGLICWGRSSRGQCGDSAAFPASGPNYNSPVTGTLTGATLVASGNFHACGFVAATNVTWCWGANDYGELGYGIPGQPSRTSVPDFVRW